MRRTKTRLLLRCLVPLLPWSNLGVGLTMTKLHKDLKSNLKGCYAYKAMVEELWSSCPPHLRLAKIDSVYTLLVRAPLALSRC